MLFYISEYIKFSAFFFHSWKTFSLLTYVIPCHTNAEVHFEVISVLVNTLTNTQLDIRLQSRSLGNIVSSKLQPQSFLIVLYSIYSNLHKLQLHLKSEIWSSHGVRVFMDLVFGPTSWQFCLLPVEKPV